MPFRTTAFEAADALGWSVGDLAKRSGIPASTLYEIRNGRRFVGPKTIPGIRKAFPQLSFEQLFVPVDSTIVESDGIVAEVAA